MSLAGVPAKTWFSLTLEFKKLPAPITASSPMKDPLAITQFAAIHTFFPIYKYSPSTDWLKTGSPLFIP